MKLEGVTVRGRRENDRWGTMGYKYPQIQNSNDHISKFRTSEKNLDFQTLKSLLTVARMVGTSDMKLGTSEQGNNRDTTAAGLST
jgi:hypothetical protein